MMDFCINVGGCNVKVVQLFEGIYSVMRRVFITQLHIYDRPLKHE